MANLIDTDATVPAQTIYGIGQKRIFRSGSYVFSLFTNQDNRIEVKVSSDAGSTWTTVGTSTYAPYNGYCCGEKNGNGAGAAVYVRQNVSTAEIRCIYFTNTTVTDVLVENSPTSGIYNLTPLLIRNTNDNTMVILYPYISVNVNSSPFGISKSIDNCASWSHISSPFIPSDCGTKVTRYMGGYFNGSSYVFLTTEFALNSGGTAYGRLLSVITMPQSFSTPSVWYPFTSGGGLTALSICGNTANQLVAVRWVDTGPNQRLNVYKNGSSISTDTSLMVPVGGRLVASLDQAGNPILLYSKADNNLYRRRYINSAWEAETLVASNAIYASTECIAQDALLYTTYQTAT